MLIRRLQELVLSLAEVHGLPLSILFHKLSLLLLAQIFQFLESLGLLIALYRTDKLTAAKRGITLSEDLFQFTISKIIYCDRLCALYL